jgi:hypothetical protein
MPTKKKEEHPIGPESISSFLSFEQPEKTTRTASGEKYDLIIKTALGSKEVMEEGQWMKIDVKGLFPDKEISTVQQGIRNRLNNEQKKKLSIRLVGKKPEQKLYLSKNRSLKD